mmetsp:Transcript_11794/g.29870  ORF Transcript_11794/g.29870 Transcript_11794/m.29870 type:complete len:246 (-) Transcript_11794:522-1259(-)
MQQVQLRTRPYIFFLPLLPLPFAPFAPFPPLLFFTLSSSLRASLPRQMHWATVAAWSSSAFCAVILAVSSSTLRCSDARWAFSASTRWKYSSYQASCRFSSSNSFWIARMWLTLSLTSSSYLRIHASTSVSFFTFFLRSASSCSLFFCAVLTSSARSRSSSATSEVSVWSQVRLSSSSRVRVVSSRFFISAEVEDRMWSISVRSLATCSSRPCTSASCSAFSFLRSFCRARSICEAFSSRAETSR